MRALVPVPIYPPSGAGVLSAYLDNTRHIVAKSSAKALITSSSIKRLLGTVKAACPALRHVVSIEGLRDAREALRPVKVGPDDVAFLQFTSGSTSKPKGVVLTHSSIVANVKAINEDALKITPEDVGVSWLPLYHDMGLIGFVLSPIFSRVPVAILSPFGFLKRPVSWLRAISRYRATISFAPNFAYSLMVKRIRERDLHGIDLSSWRVAGCGAEPIRADTLEAFSRTFSRFGFSPKALVPSYGMAESTLAVGFSQVGGGVMTDTVHGPSLWGDGVAQPVSNEHEEAIRLVRCGKAFPNHRIGVFALDDETSSYPLPRSHRGRAAPSGARA